MDSYTREQLADLCHRQWAGWMHYLFEHGVFNKDGSFTINAKSAQRWLRQSNTPYTRLSRVEQASDLKEADKFIKLLSKKTVSMKSASAELLLQAPALASVAAADLAMRRYSFGTMRQGILNESAKLDAQTNELSKKKTVSPYSVRKVKRT